MVKRPLVLRATRPCRGRSRRQAGVDGAEVLSVVVPAPWVGEEYMGPSVNVGAGNRVGARSDEVNVGVLA